MTLKVILDAVPAPKSPQGTSNAVALEASRGSVRLATSQSAQEATVTSIKTRPAPSERVRDLSKAEFLAKELATSIREEGEAQDAHFNIDRVDVRRHL